MVGANTLNQPSERITLALKPKPPEPGAKPPVLNEPIPHGLDPAVYLELKQATLTYDYLRRFGDPVEFWEAVRLARSHRGPPEEGSSSDNGLAEELQVIRRSLSPMVRDLRHFLKHVPDLPPPGEQLEVSLGFLLASSREHQAVAKWLAESDKHLSKAASKLRSLAAIAAPYLEALRPWSLDAPLKPLKSDKAVDEAAAPAVPLDPAVLEDFRRAWLTYQIFVETDLQAAFWEILMLNSIERLPCQSRLESIGKAKNAKQMAAFHEEARTLHARIMPLRARHGRWVDALENFVRTVTGPPKDASLFAITMGFAVIEPGAMDRARRWLTEPQSSAKEATAHLTGLVRLAKAYIAAR